MGLVFYDGHEVTLRVVRAADEAGVVIGRRDVEEAAGDMDTLQRRIAERAESLRSGPQAFDPTDPMFQP